MAGFHFPLEPLRLQRCSLAAVSGDTAAVSNDCTGDQLLVSEPTDQMSIHEEHTGVSGGSVEGEDDPECLDDHKMIRVCNKLIEVFMVDKPTSTDWRRLLAFSKEWSSIRPHFYRLCQERADNESDPGMKHRLLRLGRKLKEVVSLLIYHNTNLLCQRYCSFCSWINLRL